MKDKPTKTLKDLQKEVNDIRNEAMSKKDNYTISLCNKLNMYVDVLLREIEAFEKNNNTPIKI